MKRHYKFALAHLFLLLLYHQNYSYAGYELTAPGDPQRRWSASVATTLEYDDNIFTREINEQGSFKTIVSPSLTLSAPFERTFIDVRYNYRATYFENRGGDPFDQSHLADFSFTHQTTPRLHLTLRDTVRIGIEPELVEIVDGIPLTLSRRDDFFYNRISWHLSYDLVRRWTLSVNGRFDCWDFKDLSASRDNDRTVMSITLSTEYNVTQNTRAGFNYQYQQTDYTEAIPTNDRSSESHLIFLSGVHRFNPKFSLQLRSGGEVRQFPGGESQSAPFFNASMSYTLTPLSTLTSGFTYSIQNTEVTSFRSTDSILLFLQANHNFTTKISSSLLLSGSIDNFRNPIPMIAEIKETSMRVQLRLSYLFRPWLRSNFEYNHSQVSSDISTRVFDRNRISLSVILTY